MVELGTPLETMGPRPRNFTADHMQRPQGSCSPASGRGLVLSARQTASWGWTSSQAMPSTLMGGPQRTTTSTVLGRSWRAWGMENAERRAPYTMHYARYWTALCSAIAAAQMPSAMTDRGAVRSGLEMR